LQLKKDVEKKPFPVKLDALYLSMARERFKNGKGLRRANLGFTPGRESFAFASGAAKTGEAHIEPSKRVFIFVKSKRPDS
jgi:hypothetical protein